MSYDNNDYVIWTACGSVFGGKQLTRVACQVCKTFPSQSTRKVLGRKRPAPAQRGIIDFFDPPKR